MNLIVHAWITSRFIKLGSHVVLLSLDPHATCPFSASDYIGHCWGWLIANHCEYTPSIRGINLSGGPYSNSVKAINTLNKVADILQTAFLKLIYEYDNCCTFIEISSKFFEISSLRCNKQSSFHDDVINWKNNSVLLAFCAGNSPVPGEFPAQRPVTRSFDVFFDLQLNKQLSKQRWRWWFETSSHSLRRHSYVFDMMNWSRVSIMELAEPKTVQLTGTDMSHYSYHTHWMFSWLHLRKSIDREQEGSYVQRIRIVLVRNITHSAIALITYGRKI